MSTSAQPRCTTILVVEDDGDVRDTLRLMLELEGYSVVTAADGKLGLEALQKIERPCLILLDLMMPVMNGWEFLGQLHREDLIATIPVVVVTAFADSGGPLDVAGVIKKPLDLDTLLDFVKKYCGDGTTSCGK